MSLIHNRQHPVQLELNLTALFAYSASIQPNGDITLRKKAVSLEGSARDAARVLGCSTRCILRLIDTEQIIGWKLNPELLNSKYRIDMNSVFQHRARCQAARREALENAPDEPRRLTRTA